jgi:excisionase family DNA binding protein
MGFKMTEQKLLTPPQVAQRLQVNERTVTQWLRKRHLRGFKIGKEWRVAVRDLEAFLEDSANIPADTVQRSDQVSYS